MSGRYVLNHKWQIRELLEISIKPKILQINPLVSTATVAILPQTVAVQSSGQRFYIVPTFAKVKTFNNHPL